MSHWCTTANGFVGFASIATGAAGWLVAKSLSRSALPGCQEDSDCDAVLASRWSRLGTIPVAIPGWLLYALILAGSLVSHPRLSLPAAPWIRPAVLGLALLAGTSALWFLGLQFLVLRRFCPYCNAVHVCGLAMACLAGSELMGLTPPLASGGSWPGGGWIGGIPAIGGGFLIGGQLLLEPKLYALETAVRPGRAVTSPIMPQGMESAPETAVPSQVAGTPRPKRRLVLLNGQVTLDANEWPLLGAPDAPHLLVYLFDYTCPACRKTHRLLSQAAQAFGPSLAILTAPAPVDPSCNPYVQKQTAMHAQACRYARLGLLVWSLDPAKYPQFDHWMFEEPELPPLGIAVRYAEQLLGTRGLDPATPDPGLDRLIAQGVAMYQATGSAKMPILLFPRASLTGLVPSPERLRAILEEQFGAVAL